MPRNPYKRRCVRPGCKGWAMRDHDLCRPHLDHVLGSRGAGAPMGNLNALKTGAGLNPLTVDQTRAIAHRLAEDPELLEEELVHLIRIFHRHRGSSTVVPRTLRTLLALQAVLKPLTDAHADILFDAELEIATSRFPAHARPEVRRRLWQVALRHSALNRLLQLREANADQPDTNTGQKQIPGVDHVLD